jgi:hypothetical protein
MAEASSQELSKLETAVKDFKDRLAVLDSVAYGASIARTGDNALMLEFGETLAKAKLINRGIDAFTSRYQGAKEYLGLGVLPLIPILAVAAITATVLGGVSLVDRFMRKAGVSQIQSDNPGMDYETAATRYENIHQSTFAKALDVGQLALILAGAAFLYFVVSR